MGYSELYPNIKQPFGFMDRICLDGKTNFFESRVTEYQKDLEPVKLDDMSFDNNF
jgi:ribonucleotide reductase beta subunit family protein with ferritin-like domain